MSTSGARLAVTFTEFMAALTDQAVEDLPVPEEPGSEWCAVLDLWLAQHNLGLVPVAHPYTL